MTVPAAIQEMVFRYFGDGALPDYSATLELLRRDPYRQVREELGRTWEVHEITDYNSDLAQVYALLDHPDRLTVRVSLVGPYALVVDPEGNVGGDPILDKMLEAQGFVLLPREVLALQVVTWAPEAEGALYEFLFEFDQGLPWSR